jgi:hypothetical protein
MNTCEYILGANITLDIEFNYMPGRGSTYDEPAEDAEIEIETVKCNGLDVETDDIYVKSHGETYWLETAIEDYIWENIHTILEGE